MSILDRLRERRARRRASAPIEPYEDDLAPPPRPLRDALSQIKDLLPTQKGRPMRNWLSGFVATTGFKYLVTMIATFIASQLGLAEGDVTAIITQLLGVIMMAWGMYESSRSKVVIAGVKERIPSNASPEEAAQIAGTVAAKAGNN